MDKDYEEVKGSLREALVLVNYAKGLLGLAKGGLSADTAVDGQGLDELLETVSDASGLLEDALRDLPCVFCKE